jgi:hypothetical protein
VSSRVYATSLSCCCAALILAWKIIKRGLRAGAKTDKTPLPHSVSFSPKTVTCVTSVVTSVVTCCCCCCLFVCLLVNTRPARDAEVLSDYTGTILQFYKFYKRGLRAGAKTDKTPLPHSVSFSPKTVTCVTSVVTSVVTCCCCCLFVCLFVCLLVNTRPARDADRIIQAQFYNFTSFNK